MGVFGAHAARSAYDGLTHGDGMGGSTTPSGAAPRQNRTLYKRKDDGGEDQLMRVLTHTHSVGVAESGCHRPAAIWPSL